MWIIATATAFLTISSGARAETTAEREGGMDVFVFDDDTLLAADGGDGESKIVARGGPVRTILTRPRLNFLPELLRSIETL